MTASLAPSCGTATYPVTAFANASLWLRRREFKSGRGDSERRGQPLNCSVRWVRLRAGLKARDGRLIHPGLRRQLLLGELGLFAGLTERHKLHCV